MAYNGSKCVRGDECRMGNCLSGECEYPSDLSPANPGYCYGNLVYSELLGRCIRKGYKDYTYFQGRRCLTSLNCNTSDYCRENECIRRSANKSWCDSSDPCAEGLACSNARCRQLCQSQPDCKYPNYTECHNPAYSVSKIYSGIAGICIEPDAMYRPWDYSVVAFKDDEQWSDDMMRQKLINKSYPSIYADFAVDPQRFLFSQRGLLYAFLLILALIAVIGTLVGFWMSKRRKRAAQQEDAGSGAAAGAQGNVGAARDVSPPRIDEPWMMPPKDADLPDYTPSVVLTDSSALPVP